MRFRVVKIDTLQQLQRLSVDGSVTSVRPASNEELEMFAELDELHAQADRLEAQLAEERARNETLTADANRLRERLLGEQMEREKDRLARSDAEVRAGLAEQELRDLLREVKEHNHG